MPGCSSASLWEAILGVLGAQAADRPAGLVAPRWRHGGNACVVALGVGGQDLVTRRLCSSLSGHAGAVTVSVCALIVAPTLLLPSAVGYEAPHLVFFGGGGGG